MIHVEVTFPSAMPWSEILRWCIAYCEHMSSDRPVYHADTTDKASSATD